MWTFGVVVAKPTGDDLPGVTKVAEQSLVEAFIPELAVVGFAEGILGGPAWGDVVPSSHRAPEPSQARRSM